MVFITCWGELEGVYLKCRDDSWGDHNILCVVLECFVWYIYQCGICCQGVIWKEYSFSVWIIGDNYKLLCVVLIVFCVVCCSGCIGMSIRPWWIILQSFWNLNVTGSTKRGLIAFLHFQLQLVIQLIVCSAYWCKIALRNRTMVRV